MRKNYILSVLLALPFLTNAQTTTVLKDINSSGSSTPKYLVTDGTSLYYSAKDGVYGSEIVVSDGTSANTTFIDAYEGTYLTGLPGTTPTNQPAGTDVRNSFIFNGKVYYKGAKSYTYNEGYGVDQADFATLCFNESTQTSDVVFQSIVIKYSTVADGVLYFSDDDNLLYSWDGTASEPTKLPNQDGVFTCYSGFFTKVGKYLIISGTWLVDDATTTDVDESAYGTELIAYNLEDNTSMLLGDFTENGDSNFSLDHMAVLRDYYLFFTAGGKLYAFTASGSLADLYSTQYNKGDLADIYVYKYLSILGNDLYFCAKDVDSEGNTTYKNQLYSFSIMSPTNYLKRLSTIEKDGEAGTYIDHYPQAYAEIGDYLYYNGKDGGNKVRLYRTDGTSVEEVVSDITAANYAPVGLDGSDNVYFVGTDDGTYGKEVYVYSPTATSIEGGVKVQSNDLTVYPNPSSGYVNVEGLNSNKASYEIYNLSGQCVERGLVQSTLINYNLNSGLYLLRIIDGTVSTVHKITVK